MKLVIAMFLFLVSVNAYGKITLEQKPVQIGKAGSTWVNWIKDKGEKYDFELVVKNESNKGMIIFLSDISCYRGNAMGEVKHTFFNTGERTIDFKPNEMKKFTLVCAYGSKTAGDFSVKIAQAFDNPNNDGKTTGKVIGKAIEWKTADEKKN